MNQANKQQPRPLCADARDCGSPNPLIAAMAKVTAITKATPKGLVLSTRFLLKTIRRLPGVRTSDLVTLHNARYAPMRLSAAQVNRILRAEGLTPRVNGRGCGVWFTWQA